LLEGFNGTTEQSVNEISDQIPPEQMQHDVLGGLEAEEPCHFDM
jgi:hypothetical protein